MYYIMDDSKTSNDPLIPDKMFSLHLNPIWRIMIIIGLDYPFNSWELSFNFMPSFHCSGWLNSCLFFILHLRSLHLTCHESWECRTSAICIHDNIWHCNVTGLMNVFFHRRYVCEPKRTNVIFGPWYHNTSFDFSSHEKHGRFHIATEETPLDAS